MEQIPKKPENLPNDGADSDKKPFFNRKGIPPTTVSIAGTIGSIVGIRNIDKRWGAIMLAASSFGDLLDGKMARGEIDIEKIIRKFIGKNEDSSDDLDSENKETGETILGTLADHIGDKIKIATILYELHRRGAAPNLVLGGIAVSNAFNAGMTAINTVRHPGKSRPVNRHGMPGRVSRVLRHWRLFRSPRKNHCRRTSAQTWHCRVHRWRTVYDKSWHRIRRRSFQKIISLIV